MSRSSRRKIFILLDLSGTVHVEDFLVPGADQALKKLRNFGLQYKFVTNTSKESTKRLLTRLNKIGVQSTQEDLFTSLSAVKMYINKHSLRPMLFLEDQALDDFSDVDTSNPNSVVVGLAPSMFHYSKLTDAFNLLKSGASLIAINKSRYFQAKSNLALGAGAFVSALEYSADKTATVIGKPSQEFFYQAISDWPNITADVTPDQCFMIGDDVRDDVGGAQAIGMKGILVKTGKYRNGDEGMITPPPYSVCDSIVEAIDLILSLVQAAD